MRIGQGPEGCDVVEAGEAAEKEAGVDGASDLGAGVDCGDDGESEHVGHVRCGEGPLRLGDDDDPVEPRHAGGQNAGEGDVAGAPEHQVVPVATRPADGLLCQPPGVDHDAVIRRRLRHVSRDGQRWKHVDRLVLVVAREAEQRRRRCRVRRHQRRGPGAGGVDGDSSGDRGGAVATSGAGEGDRWTHRRSSSGGWWANRGEGWVWVDGRTTGGFPDRDRRPALDERDVLSTPGGPGAGRGRAPLRAAAAAPRPAAGAAVRGIVVRRGHPQRGPPPGIAAVGPACG